MKEDSLCKTLSGVYVPLLTITSNIQTEDFNYLDEEL